MPKRQTKIVPQAETFVAVLRQQADKKVYTFLRGGEAAVDYITFGQPEQRARAVVSPSAY